MLTRQRELHSRRVGELNELVQLNKAHRAPCRCQRCDRELVNLRKLLASLQAVCTVVHNFTAVGSPPAARSAIAEQLGRALDDVATLDPRIAQVRDGFSEVQQSGLGGYLLGAASGAGRPGLGNSAVARH